MKREVTQPTADPRTTKSFQRTADITNLKRTCEGILNFYPLLHTLHRTITEMVVCVCFEGFSTHSGPNTNLTPFEAIVKNDTALFLNKASATLWDGKKPSSLLRQPSVLNPRRPCKFPEAGFCSWKGTDNAGRRTLGEKSSWIPSFPLLGAGNA